MLTKLKDNNRGDIPLSFVFVVLTLMILCCGFLDLFNIFRLKSVMVKEAQVVTAACINQSGFKSSVPKDWTDVFGETLGKKNYLTSTKDTMEQITLKLDAGGTKKIESNKDCTMQHNSSGTLIFKCAYNLKYLSSMGLLKDGLICEVSNPVVGFWVHKNSQI